MTVCSSLGGLSVSRLLGNIAPPVLGRGGTVGVAPSGVGLGGALDAVPARAGGDEGCDDADAPRPIIVAFRMGGGLSGGGERFASADKATGAAATAVAESGPGRADWGAGRAGGVVLVAGWAAAGVSSFDSNAMPASLRVFMSRSMTALEGSSILMNFTPMPAGRSPF